VTWATIAILNKSRTNGGENLQGGTVGAPGIAKPLAKARRALHVAVLGDFSLKSFGTHQKHC
jgi:hypothetical protein